jgi:hypothetical protein
MSGVKMNPKQWIKQNEVAEIEKKKEVKIKDKLYNEYMEAQQVKKAKAMDRMRWKAPQCHTRRYPGVKRLDKKTRERLEKHEGFIDFCKFSTLAEEKEAYKKAKKEGKEGNGYYKEEEAEDREEDGDLL